MSVSRFRVEEGKTCIDVRLNNPRQLFDLRDPAPFRERDLEPAAAFHILSTVKEIPRRRPLKIVLHFIDPSDPPIGHQVISTAIQSHFEYERELVHTQLRENFQLGWRFAILGFVVLAIFLSLGELASKLLPAGTLANLLQEGCTITAWVSLWRPAEVLIYGWWPLLRERAWINKVLATEIDVRMANASFAPLPPT